MRKLMFFLLVIFGALYLGAQDNVHIIRESEVNNRTKITIPAPDSIWDNVFIFKYGATDVQNYYVWHDKKPRDLKHEDSLVKYSRFKSYTIETTKILLSDSISGKNIIVSKPRPESSNFAYEIIFIFVIASIIIVVLQRIKNKGNQNYKQIEVLIFILVVVFILAFFIPEMDKGIRMILYFIALPIFSLVLSSLILSKKKTKLITTSYFLMNLLSSIIIILLFPKIIPLLVANIAGLFLGMVIICVLKITKKNNVEEVYKEKFCNTFYQ